MKLLPKSPFAFPVILLFWLLPLPAHAQSPDVDWNARLVGKPLYLRGLWISDQLEFGGDGNLRGSFPPGPVTLSGIDITKVELKGRSLLVYGDRVALVQGNGVEHELERKRIASTTHLEFSLRHGDKRNFHASEEIRILIAPDASGSFDIAVKTVFADGLADLATSLPVYWKCYALSYFQPSTIDSGAEQDVQRCTTRCDDGSTVSNSEVTQGPEMIERSAPELPERARELGVGGTAIVHVHVRADGVPVGLQIVRAVGSGIDEALLQSVSQARFRPGTHDDDPVASDIDLSFQFLHQP